MNKVLRDHLESPGQRVQPDLRVHLVPPDLQDRKDQQEPQEPQVPPARREPRVNKDQQVNKVYKDRPV